MRLSRFSAKAEYVPGKYMVVADHLSRAPLEQKENASEKDLLQQVEAYVGSLIQCLPTTANKLERIRKTQLEDPCLSRVISFTLQGWPDNVAEDDTFGLLPYWAARRHLSVVDTSLLIYRGRIVILHSMQKEMHSRIHDDGHLSLHKCRQRMQESV